MELFISEVDGSRAITLINLKITYGTIWFPRSFLLSVAYRHPLQMIQLVMDKDYCG